jgi:hypothetical protein
MIAVFPAAVLLLAQAPAADAASTPPETKAASDSCGQSTDSTTIVICTQRSDGYRLNPDVMEARRQIKNNSRPVSPYAAPRPDCATVGPAPCMNAGINLLAAAVTAAEMAKRLAEGKEIGSMFVTDPHPSEYQLYQMAKARREAREAEEAAMAKAKAAQAAKAANAAQAGQSAQPPAK